MDLSFANAHVGIPKEASITNKAIYGIQKNLNLEDLIIKGQQFPVVFYMSGSKGFTKGEYRKWITEQTKCIFFAPNSLYIKDRPFYKQGDKLAQYEKVHKLRQAEIAFNLEKVLKYNFLNKNKIFLVGNSEGAVASARYTGLEFFSRIILAWSCESCYYTANPDIGADKLDPILAIMGENDEFFSKKSLFNKDYNINGNCANALAPFHNSTNIILKDNGHDITKNKETKPLITDFINYWS